MLFSDAWHVHYGSLSASDLTGYSFSGAKLYYEDILPWNNL